MIRKRIPDQRVDFHIGCVLRLFQDHDVSTVVFVDILEFDTGAGQPFARSTRSAPITSGNDATSLGTVSLREVADS